MIAGCNPAPCQILATHVTVFQSCTVDLNWERSVHACGTGGQRCVPLPNTNRVPSFPRLGFIPDEPAICPSGVHMGRCLPHVVPPVLPQLPLVTVLPPDLPHPARRPQSSASLDTSPTVSGSCSPVPPLSNAIPKPSVDSVSIPITRPKSSDSDYISTKSQNSRSSESDSTSDSKKIPVNVVYSSSVKEADKTKVENSDVNDKSSIITKSKVDISTPTSPNSQDVNKTSKAINDLGIIPKPFLDSGLSNETSNVLINDTSQISSDKERSTEEISDKSESTILEPATDTISDDSLLDNSLENTTALAFSSSTIDEVPGDLDQVSPKVEPGIQPEIVGDTPISDKSSVVNGDYTADSGRSSLKNGHESTSTSLPPDNHQQHQRRRRGSGGSAAEPRLPMSSTVIPRFYFPQGRPREPNQLESEYLAISTGLDTLVPGGNSLIERSKFADITKLCRLPLYWKQALYHAAGGHDESKVSKEAFLSMWKKIINACHDDNTKFIWMLTRGQRQYLVANDFYPLIQDILETHPGLSFLISAKDFHCRYVATVVSRIFFSVNASWTGRITLVELRRSNFLSVLASLEHEEDINAVTQYFSYEHFYVIYCKFWELDDDHDLLISKTDLSRHNSYAISERMIDRIFSGAVTRGPSLKEDMMTYPDFVWFLLAEEDKRHPRSVEYWFRCMDLDGDGVLSMYELEYFYTEQLFKMEEMGIEPISFEDCLCQMLDMVKPRDRTCIRLSDLKQCKLCNIFFDTFFNLHKYLEHEQKDPFTNLRDIEEGLNELSDWDRFAAEAYEILVAEDNNQAQEEDYVYDDDFEADDDDIQLRPMNQSGLGNASANNRDDIHFLDAMGLDFTSKSLANNKQKKQFS